MPEFAPKGVKKLYKLAKEAHGGRHSTTKGLRMHFTATRTEPHPSTTSARALGKTTTAEREAAAATVARKS
jgi:hypothetical protein